MPIFDDDLKEWEEFKKSCKRTAKASSEKISEAGKKLIKTVKENIKKHSSEINLSATFDQKDYFLLDKGISLGIDKNSDKKLSKGKFKIDYRLDLHGMTLDQAYEKLKFLFELSENKNFKCLLIITGKGLHSKDKTIKSSIIEWFAEPRFANKIIKYVDAHVKDGGSGALYVLLRNKK